MGNLRPAYTDDRDIRLTGFAAAPTLHFDGMDTREFRVAMMARDPALPTLVRWVMLDDASDGSFNFTEAVGYAEVVISIANVYPVTNGSYSYTIDVPVDPDLFDDGFETGDTSQWSTSVP